MFTDIHLLHIYKQFCRFSKEHGICMNSRMAISIRDKSEKAWMFYKDKDFTDGLPMLHVGFSVKGSIRRCQYKVSVRH